LLAIRVLDQQGAGFEGARVTWLLRSVAPGARLTVINAVTDSNGVSRAAFTPGATASLQGPIAEVAGIGRITFNVSVPVASLRIVPSSKVIPAGEEFVVETELADSSGLVLGDGELEWSSGDTVVARVRSERARAVVAARAAGSTVVRARAGAAVGSMRLTVRPVLELELLTLNGSPAPDMSLELIAADARDTVSVRRGAASAGLNLSAEPTGPVDVVLTPVVEGTVHPARVRLPSLRALRGLRIALVPEFWEIQGGSYDGSEVRIHASAVEGRQRGISGFWHLTPTRKGRPPRVVGWRDGDFPLRLAFDRPGSARGTRISAGDSAAFWAIADQMERDLGMDVFAPAQLLEERAAGFARVGVSPQESSGHAFVTWNDDGDAFDGSVILRDVATLRSPEIVTHELLHLLGFGHSLSWPTVSMPVVGNEKRLTAADVAHVQVALALRRLYYLRGALPGIPGEPVSPPRFGDQPPPPR
jgi:hypothetical protein